MHIYTSAGSTNVDLNLHNARDAIEKAMRSGCEIFLFVR